MKIKMKPETIARRAVERVRDRETRYAEATARLNETVARHEAAGDFEAAAIFREILAEREAVKSIDEGTDTAVVLFAM